MERIYILYHEYDVDGGFGDAVPSRDIIGFVKSEEKAKEYCKRWSCTHVYDKPYAELKCGTVTYQELDEAVLDISPWNEIVKRRFANREERETKSPWKP